MAAMFCTSAITIDTIACAPRTHDISDTLGL